MASGHISRWRFLRRTKDAGTLIYDGGFKKDLSGGGFGWQETEDIPGANFDFDADSQAFRRAFGGNRFRWNSEPELWASISAGARVSGNALSLSRDTCARIKLPPKAACGLKSTIHKGHEKFGRSYPQCTRHDALDAGRGRIHDRAADNLIRVRVFRRQPSQRLDNKISGKLWWTTWEFFRQARSHERDPRGHLHSGYLRRARPWRGRAVVRGRAGGRRRGFAPGLGMDFRDQSGPPAGLESAVLAAAGCPGWWGPCNGERESAWFRS